MQKLKKIFNKAGGFGLFKQYFKARLFLYACFMALVLGFSKKSLEIFRSIMEYKIYRKLERKNRKFIQNYLLGNPYEPNDLDSKKADIIWICWLQGIENAPPIVRKCSSSIQANIKNKEIKYIDLNNYSDYVCMPDFIIDKYNQGIIGHAHFSDLLRLELLINHGGTWMDSTLLCTSQDVPSFMLNSPLFVFQQLKPGLDGHTVSMSNWFISSYKDNLVLKLTRDLLYNYWGKYNIAINYYIFHMFFKMALKAYPQISNKIIPCANSTPHILLLRLFEDFDAEIYEGVKCQTCFHKLSYKFEEEDMEKENTYYKHIIDLF